MSPVIVRVSSAVGEGSVVVSSVHRYLARHTRYRRGIGLRCRSVQDAVRPQRTREVRNFPCRGICPDKSPDSSGRRRGVDDPVPTQLGFRVDECDLVSPSVVPFARNVVLAPWIESLECGRESAMSAVRALDECEPATGRRAIGGRSPCGGTRAGASVVGIELEIVLALGGARAGGGVGDSPRRRRRRSSSSARRALV